MKLIRAPSMATHTLRPRSAALLIVITLCIFPAGLNAQTGELPNSSTDIVVYHFTGGIDGGTPYAGVVFDQAGKLYGTTKSGGAYGHGTVYQLTPSEGGWSETVLHSFTGGADGDSPFAKLFLDKYGRLWGTTFQGGDAGGGTLFDLNPTEGGWTFNLVHTFTGGSDGAHPAAGVFVDPGGEIFGTTTEGGVSSLWCEHLGCGTIFWLGGPGYFVWNKFITKDGNQPQSSLFYDDANKCFLGTTVWGHGPTGWGTVFADCDRYIITLHTFGLNGTAGVNPLAGVLLDSHGNVYGTTSDGVNNKGAVFKIVAAQGGGSAVKALHQFLGPDGAKPAGDLLFDPAGNIYGTTSLGGAYGKGVLFKLTPGLRQAWTQTLLYSFGDADGANPLTSLVFDNSDNLYGTTSAGGAYGAGVVFKIPNIRMGPQPTLTPKSLSFGNQVINTTSLAKLVTLSNIGDDLLTISSITASSNFAVSSNTCGAVLALGAQCKVSVTFMPTVLGKLTGTLTFTDNASNNPQTVPLVGIGVLPATLSPVSANYPVAGVGRTSSPKTFTLTNNQTIALDSIAISTTGDFAISASACVTSLPAKGKCTISVTFTPTAAGKRTGSLRVSDSANNSPQIATLTGTGV